MDPVWQGYITKGVDGAQFFELDLFDEFTVYLGRFKPDEKIEVILRKQTKKSSNAQNRYYYGVVCKIISDFTGHTIEEVDGILKDKFLKQKDERGDAKRTLAASLVNGLSASRDPEGEN